MIDHSLPSRRHLILVLLLVPAITGWAAPIADQLTTAENLQQQREARLVVDLLQNHHYSGKAFRDLDSATMISRFMEELDPRAEFFTADDVAMLHRRFDRTLKTVYLFRGDLRPAYEIFDVFNARAKARFAWVQPRLEQDFDFTLPGTVRERSAPTPFANPAEADHYWELALKEHVLVERLRGRSPAEATAEVARRFEQAARAIGAYDPLAVRERFFDTVIRSYDPHSGYFSSDSAREFAMEMEKALVGLGVELRKEEGRCVVAAVQLGGPASLHSDLEPGDSIEALAEGESGPWRDLANLRLREIIDLLRGPAGSKLRVAYRHADQPERREIVIERARVEMAADRAYGAVSEVPATAGAAHRVGWIRLPSFYAAGEGSNLSSSARDVAELLQQMTASQPLDGLVIDLRDNPGGALTEAVALSELFIPGGVMMLSRGADGKLKEHAVQPGKQAYAGPLVLLTSASSASAAEVFAGAMRYHHRAVIVGATATFGKGSVQAYIELGKMGPREAKDWGTLRLTTEKFFQPDGSAVQRAGVAAHVVFPALDLAKPAPREAELPGALPAETVAKPAGLTPSFAGPLAVSDSLVDQLRSQAETDARDLPEWVLRRDEHGVWSKYYTDQEHTLVQSERAQQWEEVRGAWHALAVRRRQLLATAAFPTQPVEVAAARQLLAEQDTRLRHASEPGPTAPARRSFTRETDRGRLRELNLADIEFARFVSDAEALAATQSDAAHPWAAADLAAFLRAVDLLRYRTPLTVENTARRLLPGGDEAGLHARLQHLFDAIARLDGELNRERVGLDVELREGLRLAGRWAELSRPPPTTP